jgi:hypothetical protein
MGCCGAVLGCFPRVFWLAGLLTLFDGLVAAGLGVAGRGWAGLVRGWSMLGWSLPLGWSKPRGATGTEIEPDPRPRRRDSIRMYSCPESPNPVALSGPCLTCVVTVYTLTFMSRPQEPDRSMVRSSQVIIRVLPGQLKRWRAKASEVGVPLSVWLRELADRAASV